MPGIAGVVRQLASKVADERANELRLAGILGSPYPLQYLVVGEYPARVVRQLVKQFIFSSRKLHLFVAHSHLPLSEVDYQVSVMIGLNDFDLVTHHPATKRGLDPCNQLRWRERLDYVVIGPKSESLHGVLFPIGS